MKLIPKFSPLGSPAPRNLISELGEVNCGGSLHAGTRFKESPDQSRRKLES